MNTKAYLLFIHSTKENAIFTDLQKAYDYISYWYLSDDATSILIDTKVYNDESLGLIELIGQDLNPLVYRTRNE